MKKTIMSLMLVAAMTLSLAACGGSSGGSGDSSGSAGSGDASAAPAASADAGSTERGETDANLDYKTADLSGMRIGYVTINSAAPWGGLVGTSFEQYATEQGATVNVLDAQTDVDKVNEYCQQMIDAGVDALVVFGGDITANAEIAKAADEAGVAMFMAGLDVAEEGRDYVKAVVGPDQYQMCADIAKYVVEQNGTEEEFKVVQINGVPFLEDYIERTGGFQDYMADYPNYDLSTEPADAYSSRTDAKSFMEQFIAGDDGIDICMGYDDDLTMGAVQAIEEAGLTDQIKVYSLTGQKDAIQAVIDGKMELTVMNRASDIGMGLVSAIGEYFTTGSTTYYQRTPLIYITPDNAEEYLDKAEF
ncbi:MAG: sugar ABC transporter substrate-binding protein [Eubacterium sp.]|nr:sugar ABC transporter substrate-binding protein [Eubacterium sp.]